MNKAEVAKRLAERTGITKAVAMDAVDGVFTATGEEVQIARFGTFGTRSKSARTARNPRTDEVVSIAASTSPTLKAGERRFRRRRAVSGIAQCWPALMMLQGAGG